MEYPAAAEERQILDRMMSGEVPAVSRVLDREAVGRLTGVVRQVFIDERIRDYIVALVRATRDPRAAGCSEIAPLVSFGASPRATLAFSDVARASAFLHGRGYVVPEDVKEVARDVLRHRLLLTYEAEAENVTTETIVDRVLDAVPVP